VGAQDIVQDTRRGQRVRREHDIGRRAFFGVAGASFGGMALARPALDQGNAAVSREQGPLVWLDMDQKALDDAYDQTVWAPNRQQLLDRFAANSEVARSRLGMPKRFAYGPTSIEQLDVFVTSRPNAPIHLFVHGGQWRGGFAKDYAFLAENLVRAGAHVVIPDFVNVLETGGDLMPMADQVKRAIAWTFRNGRSFGGDPARLFVSGHSSGAHLAAVATVTDWAGEFGVPVDVLKGALLCSAMYDLKPVALSARSSYVKFTPAMEEALSAQRHLTRLACPVIAAYGTLETPEFQRQSRDFAAAASAMGKPVALLVAPHCNHFEILETMANPYGLLGSAVLRQMQLT
jgi:arylformamidase